jgi:hypothetical protein
MTMAEVDVDDLLGAPSNAEVRAAQRFLESCSYSTTALLAVVAVLREQFEEPAQALLLESICEDFAELELESVEG